ncbi:MAG: hypothetical protein K6T78_08850 [Alicyclobacillus sp.]|nr:hypothetical protein [Alicyclobacillus sp.]
MRKFLIFVAVIAVLVLGAYKFYPTQTELAQSTLTVAGKNLGTAIALSVEALGKGNDTANTTPVTTQKKSSSDVGGSKTQEVSKPVQHVQKVQKVQQVKKEVVYSGGSNAVAPANATCFINTPTDQSERVTPAQWNAFVKQHPDYVRAVTSQNGVPVYVASAPNLTNPGTAAQQQNQYFVVTQDEPATTDYAVTYGTFEADVKAHEGQGWKIFHDGNSYALVAPNEIFTFPDGKQFSNAQ